jgi:hypothetical protein
MKVERDEGRWFGKSFVRWQLQCSDSRLHERLINFCGSFIFFRMMSKGFLERKNVEETIKTISGALTAKRRRAAVNFPIQFIMKPMPTL